MDGNQLSVIAKLFSKTALQDLCHYGRSPCVAKTVENLSRVGAIAPTDRVSDLYEAAFTILKSKDNRHEYVYKSALTTNILLGTHSLSTASMLTEFRVRKTKADLIILNGTSTAYEIKSERDSLTKLERQISDYRSVFASVYAIVGENHIDAATDLVPKDVGILRLTDRHRISTIRKAINLPGRTDPEAIFDSIRLDEAKHILSVNKIRIPDVPNTEMYLALKGLFAKLSPSKAHSGMVDTLRLTRSQEPLREILFQLPRSLRSAALSSIGKWKDHEPLLNAMNASVKDAQLWT